MNSVGVFMNSMCFSWCNSSTMQFKCAISTGGGERNFWNCTRPGLRILHHTLNQRSQQPCNTYSFSQEIPLSQFTALTTALQNL